MQANNTTGQRSKLWDAATTGPAVPEGWEAKVSATKGKTYYYHKQSGKTTWVHPGLAKSTQGTTRPAPHCLPIASVDDAPAVPECLHINVGEGMFPVMLKANSPAGCVVGVRVPTGFAGAGRVVTVLVPTDAPVDSCFWIVVPFPVDLLKALGREDSDSWSSCAGSVASTVLHDSASTGSFEEFDLDALEDCEDDGWDFEQHEKEVRATAQAARALAGRTFSPDFTMLAPEEAAAPAILISRTPSPQELVSLRTPIQQQQERENPFTKQLHLLRGAESHNETLHSTSALPAGWEKKMSVSKGKQYYYNSTTRETTWVKPTV